jgi:hypothetical protein
VSPMSPDSFLRMDLLCDQELIREQPSLYGLPILKHKQTWVSIYSQRINYNHSPILPYCDSPVAILRFIRTNAQCSRTEILIDVEMQRTVSATVSTNPSSSCCREPLGERFPCHILAFSIQRFIGQFPFSPEVQPRNFEAEI